MTGWLVCGLVVVSAAPALADDGETLDARWPAVPPSHQLKMDEQIADRLSEMGNKFVGHIDVLSHDMIKMHFDARAGHARLRVGGGNVRYLTFRLDSDWHFIGNKADVHARLDLGIAGHVWRLDLPMMEVIPDSFHGQQLVELNVPLLSRHF